MRSYFLGLMMCLMAMATPAAAADAQGKAVPMGNVLVDASGAAEHPVPAHGEGPLTVRAAIAYRDVLSFADQDGRFNATIALRLVWSDSALRSAAVPGGKPFSEFKAQDAEKQLASMWVPRIRIMNLDGELKRVDRNLKIYHDGTVELVTQATGSFKTPVDISKFPYDDQNLEITIAGYGGDSDQFALALAEPDLSYARSMPSQDLDGWNVGPVKLITGTLDDFDGNKYSQVTSSLEVSRISIEAIVSLCLPLLASLLIPFLAIWLNRPEGDGFTVDAFELANVVIGGLFAVIALGITISSSSPSLVVEDNVVSRLLTLNYASLGFGILVVLLMYQFTLVERLFGEKAQRRAHAVLSWAYPASVALIAATIMILPAH